MDQPLGSVGSYTPVRNPAAEVALLSIAWPTTGVLASVIPSPTAATTAATARTWARFSRSPRRCGSLGTWLMRSSSQATAPASSRPITSIELPPVGQGMNAGYGSDGELGSSAGQAAKRPSSRRSCRSPASCWSGWAAAGQLRRSRWLHLQAGRQLSYGLLGVAAVAAEGALERQLAVHGPAAHGLGGNLEDLGRLPHPQIGRLPRGDRGRVRCLGGHVRAATLGAHLSTPFQVPSGPRAGSELPGPLHVQR